MRTQRPAAVCLQEAAQQQHLERLQSGSLASARPQQYGYDSHPYAQHHRPYRPSQPEVIVSLVPAGTEILYALGLGSRCVCGRSHI